MRTVRFVLSLFLVLSLFVFVECEKGDFRYTYFFFEEYFVPPGADIALGANKCGVSLSSNRYIVGMGNPDFRELAAEYGEMGKKRFSLIPPPFRKPYNLQGIKIWQGEGEGRVDVYAKVQLSYWGYSEYINSGYEYEKKGKLAGGYVSELTEHDLKWLTQGFTLNFGQLRKNELVLEITTKGGASFRKRLSDDF